VPAERLGEGAGQVLRAELEAGAALDVHAADQLLIYAAQARGTSRFTVREVSQHARTVMWLIEQFLPVVSTLRRGRESIGSRSSMAETWYPRGAFDAAGDRARLAADARRGRGIAECMAAAGGARRPPALILYVAGWMWL